MKIDGLTKDECLRLLCLGWALDSNNNERKVHNSCAVERAERYYQYIIKGDDGFSRKYISESGSLTTG